MSFHDVLFPTTISFGSSGGPERRTEIVSLASGYEERNTIWAHSRRRFDAGLGLRNLDDVHAVIAFFEARLGMLHAFRWKDWVDFKSCPPQQAISEFDQPIGVGDGQRTGFQLMRRYASGDHHYDRPITKPAPGTVRLAVDGVALAVGDDFSIDASTGLVTLAAAPVAGAAVTAGYEFHVPARFDTDRIEVNLGAFEAGEIPSVPIIEVRV